MQLPYGRVVLQRVPWHEHDAGCTGCLDDQASFGGGCRERLLDKDMLALLDCLQTQSCVMRRWGGDDQGVHIWDSLCQVGISEYIDINTLGPASGSGKPLVNADDGCHTSGGPQHAHVL